MAGEEGQRRRLLLAEERAGVAALGQVHHGSGWESPPERPDARIERVVIAGRDQDRDASQRRGVRDRVVAAKAAAEAYAPGLADCAWA